MTVCIYGHVIMLSHKACVATWNFLSSQALMPNRKYSRRLLPQEYLAIDHPYKVSKHILAQVCTCHLSLPRYNKDEKL